MTKHRKPLAAANATVAIDAFVLPLCTRPYINPFVVSRIVNNHTQLLRSGDEPAEFAMRAAAREINARIRKNIRTDPLVRERYQREANERASEERGGKP
jgi:tetraacyldisaccharide-1-P 4'-kinase